MFIQYLRHTCLFFILLTFNSMAFADVYKWIDETKQTNYGETPPRGQEAELIKAPPPPVRSADTAQQEVNTLIEKQNGTYEAKQEERLLAKEEAEEAAKKEEYCRVNKHNLQQYQNNPGRRMMDADGNIIAPNEEQRLEKIAEIKARIAEDCQ